MWRKLKKIFGGKGGSDEPPPTPQPAEVSKPGGGTPPPRDPTVVGWLAGAENPYGVPVVDLRPFTLTMLSPSRVGLPYGSLPRLLVAWLTTEAVRTREREIVLGERLSEFMAKLDLVPTGGPWGTIIRLRDQMEGKTRLRFYAR